MSETPADPSAAERPVAVPPTPEAPAAAPASLPAAERRRPRVKQPDREQAPIVVPRLDNLLPADHLARVVWSMVKLLDLSAFYAPIKAVEGAAGREAIDPMLLVALWLYATADGVSSARELDQCCRENVAYIWLCGGVSVNYHTLADFRVAHERALDALLTQQVAGLMASGLVHLDRTAQDGLRLRASAGSNSFRRRSRLEAFEQAAAARVAALKATSTADQQQRTARQRAAQERAAQERLKRVQEAVQALAEVEAAHAKSHKKKSELKEPRASTTDPSARVMQMPAGAFRPAQNAELTVDTHSGIIVDAATTNQVDQAQGVPALHRLQARYGRLPGEHLVDGGFVVTDLFAFCRRMGIAVYAPLPKSNRFGPSPAELGVQTWLERMGTEVAKVIYKLRAQTVEWANAGMRQRDLDQLTVRGLDKGHCVVLWQALTHNLLRSVALLRQQAAA